MKIIRLKFLIMKALWLNYLYKSNSYGRWQDVGNTVLSYRHKK